MTILITSEVEENIALSKSHPAEYRLAITTDIPCHICGDNFLRVFAKDAEFTKFECPECWEI